MIINKTFIGHLLYTCHVFKQLVIADKRSISQEIFFDLDQGCKSNNDLKHFAGGDEGSESKDCSGVADELFYWCNITQKYLFHKWLTSTQKMWIKPLDQVLARKHLIHKYTYLMFIQPMMT